MAQRASLRDHASLAVEKRRSNRTVYIPPGRVLSSLEGPSPPGWMAQSAVVRWETRLTFGKGVIEADSSMPKAFRTLLRAPDRDLAERCAGGRMRGLSQPCGPDLLGSARPFYPPQR
jgi:hypothetical protein